jgi:uncharacterized membrane protein YgcG
LCCHSPTSPVVTTTLLSFPKDEDVSAGDHEAPAEEEEEPIKKHSAADALAAPSSDFSDETLTCVDCNGEFIFTIGQQEFFAEKGFSNKPQRCEGCQRAKKERMNGGGGGRGGGGRGGFSSGGGGGGGGGACYAFQRGGT